MPFNTSTPISSASLRAHLAQLISPSNEEWDAFYSKLKTRQLKKDETYLAEGDVCRRIGIVTKGGLRMYYNIKGEERCKDFQFEGQFTGSMASLVSGQPALFTIAALEDTDLLEITKEELFHLYEKYKTWERFGRLYAQMMFIYKEKREASLLFDSSTTRYENLLRDQPQHAHRIPLKYLASYLGIKPESLSRIRKNIARRSRT
ncbi:MAG TPA: Crp/Fnr family transcriptional regulator [Cyclobacteriaceae bacterium]|nr:Crp/Fnr family transcriptional regulator [Cyclobacteriaceae bacterium]